MEYTEMHFTEDKEQTAQKNKKKGTQTKYKRHQKEMEMNENIKAEELEV
jgi:hypothetical protein